MFPSATDHRRTTTMTTTATTTETLVPLPGPDARPGADIVIFDGNCRICSAQMHWLAACDRGARLAYLSLHDPEAARRYPDLLHEDLMRQMYVVDRTGRRHGGADAVRYLTRRLPRLWVLAPLLHVPFSLPLWRWLYGVVAARRYLFGRVESCDYGSCAVHHGTNATRGERPA